MDRKRMRIITDPKVEAASSRFQEFGYFHKTEERMSGSSNIQNPHCIKVFVTKGMSLPH